ncbi:MAG: DHHA1 domain-containing protein, partial [Aestuariivirgaceae bacterium]
GDLFVHYGRVESGECRRGEAVELIVDADRRTGTQIHHSATHLMHEALRQVLGTHVTQKGSLVEPDRLRFDFSHTKAMDPDELSAVEELANAVVLQNDDVATRLMSVDEAIEEGAMALFGEKYGDEVRVVSMGVQPGGDGNKPVYSLELCGGTHVARTGDIGLIKLVSESASAAGVRRLEALAGPAARHHLETQDKLLGEVAAVLKVPNSDVPARVGALVEERRRLERELAEAKKQLALGGSPGDSGQSEIAGTKVLMRAVHGINPKDLRGMIDDGKQQLGSGVVAVIGVTEDGKAGIAVGVTEDLTDRFNAVDLVRIGATALGGRGGGGRPDMAQAGGPDGSLADHALDQIREAVAAAA